MKRILAIAALLAVSLAGPGITAAQQAKPNIILILTNNLGWGELGVYGGGFLRLLSRESDWLSAGSRACLSISGYFRGRLFGQSLPRMFENDPFSDCPFLFPCTPLNAAPPWPALS